MEKTGLAPPHDLESLRIDVLRRAVRIYLERAHPSGAPPAAVLRRLEWLDAAADAAPLACPPFERVARTDGEGTSIYALRLGNHRYPHMKLQVQPWPNPSGFLLSVNTHDQVLALALDPTSADADAFRALQSENQRLKEEIESAWDSAGLPTFLRYLRDYIQAQPAQDESPK